MGAGHRWALEPRLAAVIYSCSLHQHCIFSWLSSCHGANPTQRRWHKKDVSDLWNPGEGWTARPPTTRTRMPLVSGAAGTRNFRAHWVFVISCLCFLVHWLHSFFTANGFFQMVGNLVTSILQNSSFDFCQQRRSDSLGSSWKKIPLKSSDWPGLYKKPPLDWSNVAKETHRIRTCKNWHVLLFLLFGCSVVSDSFRLHGL